MKFSARPYCLPGCAIETGREWRPGRKLTTTPEPSSLALLSESSRSPAVGWEAAPYGSAPLAKVSEARNIKALNDLTFLAMALMTIA